MLFLTDITATVNLSLSDPGATKAVSKADNVDRVYYEVWNADFSERIYPKLDGDVNYVPVSNLKATLNVSLRARQTYNFLFWAQNSRTNAYTWEDLRYVDIDYSKFIQNNKDVYDAFYASSIISIADKDDVAERFVTLYRPFAQLNFGASVMETVISPFSIESHSLTISEVATRFNILTGNPEPGENGEFVKSVTFSAPEGGLVQEESENKMDLNVNGTPYYWVSMNYILVPSQTRTTVDVTAAFKTTQGDVNFPVSNVSLLRNHRTNVVGDLFTSDAQFLGKPQFEIVIMEGITDDYLPN
jgi:hypothetical protein